MYNSWWNEKKIGSYLPVNPSQKMVETVPEESFLIQVYKKVTSLIDSEEWTLKDYKQFRREIATCPLSEMNVMGKFLLYLLSVPQESFSETISFLNDLFQLHILDERVKVIKTDLETGEEKTYYEIQNRPAKITDIIRVPMAIQSLISSTFYLASVDSFFGREYPEDSRCRVEQLVEFFEGECQRGGTMEDLIKQFLFDAFSFMKDKTLLNEFVREEADFQLYKIHKTIQNLIVKESRKVDAEYVSYRYLSLQEFHFAKARENSQKQKIYLSHDD